LLASSLDYFPTVLLDTATTSAMRTLKNANTENTSSYQIKLSKMKVAIKNKHIPNISEKHL